MATFQGLGVIELQPHDEGLGYTFEFEVASAADANDGSIPYGETISSATATIHKHPVGTDYSTEIITNTGNTTLVVTLTLRYPYITLLNGGEPLGEVTMVVDSTAGMVAGDIIGVYQDDGTIHWTTISSVTDAATLVLTTGLASAAATTNRVLVPRLVKGTYHLRLVVTYSGSGDKEWDFNRVYVRDR